MKRSNTGFTLLEILIVVMIIGLLMTLVGTQLVRRGQGAKVDLCGAQIRNLERALESYRLDNGRYPTSEQGLEALISEPASDPKPRRYQPGGYIDRKALQDPWDMRYEYNAPGMHNAHSFDLYSLGPDAAEGGEGENADIVNWDTGTYE